ncbi:MAG: nucleoside kinase [Peptoniphilaceae bacterium]|nr:nucleoside kinase [Peptoniphilaceae bacterium]MDY6085885.1 nucleoside kinase [Peptoniphilaceae bacterium]
MNQATVNYMRDGMLLEEEVSFEEGATFSQVADQVGSFMRGQVTLARVGNLLYELTAEIPVGTTTLSLIDTTDMDGYRVYMRTLAFIFLEAVHKLMPDTQTVVEHSISGGLYCVVRRDDEPLTLDTATRNRIKEKMADIIAANLSVERVRMPFSEAQELFAKLGRKDKVDLFAQQPDAEVSVYRMGDAVDSFYGYMAPSTGYVKTFDLELFDHGLVLLGVDHDDRTRVNNFLPTYLLSDIYNEAEDWSRMQGIFTVAQLNATIQNGTIGDVCRMNEALHEHKLMTIAEQISSEQKRIVLIAAPSSSGKTSFAVKLMTSLRVLGRRPIAISLDDYFVNRDATPLGDDGEPDFEALEAIDLARFERDMKALLAGETVERIAFDFITGTRVSTGKMMTLDAKSPILIEGIHGLNPRLLADIDDRNKMRIALSVITQINLDDHNRIPTTDLRLMRRMARDLQFRGRDVRTTIRSWPSVRAGEDRNIFPYSERADIMFNSSFVYEIAALKPILLAPLSEINPDEPEYIESSRLLSLLSYFLPMTDTSDVVSTSILREFIGGSKIVS